MKSILLSMRPEHAVNVLNGKKTFELRKSIPKELKEIIKQYGGIWVYIYVSKGNRQMVYEDDNYGVVYIEPRYTLLYGYGEKRGKEIFDVLNQKVLARFWFDEYDEMSYMTCNGYEYDYYATNNKDKAFGWCVDSNYIEDFCLEYQDILNYGYNKKKRKQVNLYAWHIKNLEIFDKPKELSEFYRVNIEEELPNKELIIELDLELEEFKRDVLKEMFAINKPPQSWQYVYVKESKDE